MQALLFAGLARSGLAARLGRRDAGWRDNGGLEGGRNFFVHGRTVGFQGIFEVYGVAATGQVQAHRVYHLPYFKEVAGAVYVLLLGDALFELDADDVGGVDEHVAPEGKAQEIGHRKGK